MPLSKAEVPPYQAAEDAFCQAWIDTREARAQPLIYTCLILVHGLSLLVEPFVLATYLTRVVWLLHAATLPFLLVGLLMRKNAYVARRALVYFLYVSILGVGLIIFYAAQVSGTTTDIVLASAIFMGTGMFMPQVFPARCHGEMVVLALVSVAIAFTAMTPVEYGWVWGYIYSTLAFWSAFLKFAARRALWREARAEYRFRLQIVPEHIVRHAQPAELGDLTEIFRPEDKFCICISSDWRNYQELCTNIAAARLTDSLNEYYALCQQLVRSAFPLGNYYTDWIADELFVVAYLTDGTSEADMTEAAARFALELLSVKAEFHRRHGLPARIDVGIAGGTALLGLMGPVGHRKATALGEIPGRARRLQGAGKIISRRLGEQDRVIIDAGCRQRLGPSFAFDRFVLDKHESIRDLKDREVFHASIATSRPREDSAVLDQAG